MKKQLFAFVAAVLVAVSGAACSPSSVGPNEQAVLVYQPYVFGSGHVDQTPVKTGLVWTSWSTQVWRVNMIASQVNVEFDDLMTSDGVPLDFHSAVQYRINDAVKMVTKFGGDTNAVPAGFWVRVLDQPYRSAVRDAVKAHGLNEMAINAKAADEVDQKVTLAMREIIKATDVPIDLLNVTLGRANPPDAIKHQRIATAEQEQRIQTEKQGKLAEDQRKEREESRAAADRAYNVKMDLNPDQYLRLETIKMQREVCAKGGCYFGFAPTFTQAVR